MNSYRCATCMHMTGGKDFFCCCFVMNRFGRSEVEGGALPCFCAAQFLQEASPTVHVYAHDRGGRMM